MKRLHLSTLLLLTILASVFLWLNVAPQLPMTVDEGIREHKLDANAASLPVNW